MKIACTLKVFATTFHLGVKEIFAQRLVLFGTFLTYATLVVAYCAVFRSLPQEYLTPHNLTHEDLMAYFCSTEFVLFCASFTFFKEMQYDIQNDHIHLSLLRPCPVWLVYLGRWSGQTFARALVLLAPCAILAHAVNPSFTPSLGTFVGFAASLPCALVILLCANFIVGISCLWFRQSEPSFWIWQKFMFLFGALLWPLALYPPFMRAFAWTTPFPAVLAVPGNWMIATSDWTALALGGAHQIVWMIVFVALTALSDRALLRRIQDGGA